MKRNWLKYLDRQSYSECQMVTALNAYYYLTGKQYCKAKDETYERLVDLCIARAGAALCIDKVHKELGIKPTKRYTNLSDALSGGSESSWYRKDGTIFGKNKGKITEHKEGTSLLSVTLPIEVSVWNRHVGSHSCLIVDYCKKVDAVRVTNLNPVTHSGWIFCSDLHHLYLHRCYSGDENSINGEGQQWHYRRFELSKRKKK